MKKSKIDRELLDWVLSIEDDFEEVYASTHGSFSFDSMDFKIFLSDEECEKFDKAEKILEANNGIAPNDEVAYDYYKPVQTYNHELVHYYQALILPAFIMYQKVYKRNTEFEAATMLRYFEYGFSYTLPKDKKVFSALDNPDFQLPDEEVINFNKLEKNYKFFRQQWKSKYKNISLFYIIEGMAHIMSIQLTPYSKNFLYNMDDNIDYNIAYDVFHSYINEQNQNMEIRVKHLIFLYVSYFSCQVYSLPEDEVLEKSSRVFYTLSSRVNLYIDTFIDLVERYAKYSESELKELNRFDINQEDIYKSNKNQLANIYALFELIPIIEQDAKAFYNPNIRISEELPREYFDVFNELNIDLTNIYQLANFALFPVRMADLWEAYERLQTVRVGNNRFTVADESAFYDFMGNCKKILSFRPFLIPCCEEHGAVEKIKLSYCKNEDSFVYHLKELTQKEISELFKNIKGELNVEK